MTSVIKFTLAILLWISCGSGAFAQTDISDSLTQSNGLLGQDISMNSENLLCGSDRLQCKQICWDEDPAIQAIKNISNFPRPTAETASGAAPNLKCYAACDESFETCADAALNREIPMTRINTYAEERSFAEHPDVQCEEQRQACEADCRDNDRATTILNDLLDEGSTGGADTSFRVTMGTCKNRCDEGYRSCQINEANN